MKVKVFQLHKRSSYEFDCIEDKYAIDQSNLLFTVSDGATQGYKSNLWAKLLTEKFIESPLFSAEELILNFKASANEFEILEHELSANSAIKALQKKKIEFGGFATFLGVKIEKDKLQYISSGDVCLFLFRDGLSQSYPFKNISELDNEKSFIGTKKLLNDEIDSSEFQNAIIPLEINDKILLTTDAIARFILKDNNILNELDKLEDFDSFKDYIILNWNEKTLEEDDITFIKIENPGNTEIEINEIIPPPNFVFTTKTNFPKSTVRKKQELVTEDIQSKFGEINNNLIHSKNKISNLYKQIKTLRCISIASVIGLIIVIVFFSWKIAALKSKKEIRETKSKSTGGIFVEEGGKINPLDSAINK